MEARYSLPEYSRRLPPPEAWRNPGKWIDLSTGLARNDASKLVLPTDDRDFVKIDEAVDYALNYFFWPDYAWEYDARDPQTALDRHHFQHRKALYLPENNGGDRTAQKFRENPTRIGLIPRQIHNVLHDFAAEPVYPDRDAMAEFNARYELAHQAFVKLIKSAKNVARASRSFSVRAEAIRAGIIDPHDETDAVAQEFMRDFFMRHFEEYGRAIDEVLRIDASEFIAQVPEKSLLEHPGQLVKKMGSYVTRSHVDIASRLNNAA